MQQLKHLEDRLLSAGVAPFYVWRTINELRDHYEDALRDAQARGLDGDAAQHAAWARLGNMEDLERMVIARPELRSVAAKYPRIIFGLGPVLLWALATFICASLFIAAILEGSYVGLLPARGPALGASIGGAADAFCFFCVRVLPVILGAAMTWSAVRHRIFALWPIAGTILIALIAGTTTPRVVFSPDGLSPNELYISSSLPEVLPFLDPPTQALSVGLLWSGAMFAMMLSPYVLQVWRGRRA